MINKKKKILSNKQKLQIIAHLKVFCNLLTKLQRRIWKYLQSFQASGKRLYMRVSTIAEKCRCCERTVQYALKLFTKMKWLTREFSSYQTTRYHLEPIYCLEKLTSIKRCEEIIERLSKNEDDGPPSRKDLPSTEEVFSERILHPNCTIPVLYKYNMSTHNEYSKKTGVNLAICNILKTKTRIDPSQYHKFYTFSEHTLVESIKEGEWAYQKYFRESKQIEDPVLFLLHICWKRHKQGIKHAS